MSNWLHFCLLATLICWTAAKHGSISDNLFEDDINDDVEEVEVIGEEKVAEMEKSRMNACFEKKCRRGEICRINDKNKAECVCIPDCSTYHTQDERAKVCSNRNETYQAECDLDRDHCLCKKNKDGCSNPGVKKIQLEYYGACQEIKDCSPENRKQFPKRLRDWLLVVMETMEKRATIGEYEDLLELARQDGNHTSAAIWGFCDLDKDPQDRFVSRRELQYTVRSLRVMEHCLVPFLDDCDADDNRKITLPEWGECLGLPHEHISDKCKDIHKAKKGNK